MHCKLLRLLPTLLAFCFLSASAQEPLTVAEKSNFEATSRHAEVVSFCEQLAKASPVVRLGELGKSHEGRKLPLVILADPPVSRPEEAAKSGKLVVFAFANIHAGEVDGKEALLMLARELAMAKERPLLKDLVIVLAPIFNADGNEKISPDNRRGQNGPAQGVGIRQNAQGLDLNRDFVKLESPEVRALVRFLNRWDPALVIDCHTTNGSRHGYTLTYEGPRNPAGDPKLVAMVQDVLLPDVTTRLEKRTGYKSFFYGNFSKDRTRWETVPANARYSTHYLGLRNTLGILSESYSYAPYRDRIQATRGFVLSCFEHVAEHREKVRELLREARKHAAHSPEVVIRHRTVAAPTPVKVLGFDGPGKDAKPREVELRYVAKTEPTVTVKRPRGYLFPASFDKAVHTLQRHGIQVDELREDIELEVETYRAAKVSRRDQVFQNHQLVTVETGVRKERRRIPAGTVLVATSQPLGSLAVTLLEPESDDGLVTWNFFDDGLKQREDYPVLRLVGQTPITTTRVKPLAEERAAKKLFTQQTATNLNGSPVSGLTWLADGEHFLQTKGGQLMKVHALSGRAEPFHDSAKLEEAFVKLTEAEKVSLQAHVDLHRLNPQRTGMYIEASGNLFYSNLDGTGAICLTRSSGGKELVQFSPDGQWLSFVRGNNLFAVDLATRTERQLTNDGTGVISNGKADWVYYEELFNRDWNAAWWSPDSKHLAFLRLDDTNVRKFSVVDHIPVRQELEQTPYPKAGDPNPTVKLGLIAPTGGPVRWVELGDYPADSTLISRVGWAPDGRQVFCYVQDRVQTWLDFCVAPATGGKARRLFRETTKAWVEDLGPPVFLKDGSFLVLSERTGWRHLYHYDRDGRLIRPVTAGEWEMTTNLFAPSPLLHVDEAAGWVYFNAKRDNPIASNLYRVRLDGSGLERLTAAPGSHQVSVSPIGKYFLDTWSSHTTPPKVRLHHADGSAARWIDTNPVHALGEFRLGKVEFLKIPTPDGFTLEGSLTLPPDFDPQKRYPVWFKTYAGPHAPTISDSWSAGQPGDQLQASMGFVIFRCDPRSASGKGAVSAWSAYRQLGVPELKDIETAINWLVQHRPYVDPGRIGMSGHSYGGFITAYALTHSKLFAAGIAGAPVTDWRNYDSIYTERYMDTPQANPKGYDQTSVVKAARNLHGKLLLIHGLMDDNVHVQNAVQLMDELQRANKDFEVMFYPRARHGIFGAHYQRLVVDFMKRHLMPEASK